MYYTVIFYSICAGSRHFSHLRVLQSARNSAAGSPAKCSQWFTPRSNWQSARRPRLSARNLHSFPHLSLPGLGKKIFLSNKNRAKNTLQMIHNFQVSPTISDSFSHEYYFHYTKLIDTIELIRFRRCEIRSVRPKFDTDAKWKIEKENGKNNSISHVRRYSFKIEKNSFGQM